MITEVTTHTIPTRMEAKHRRTTTSSRQQRQGQKALSNRPPRHHTEAPWIRSISGAMKQWGWRRLIQQQSSNGASRQAITKNSSRRLSAHQWWLRQAAELQCQWIRTRTNNRRTITRRFLATINESLIRYFEHILLQFHCVLMSSSPYPR